MKVKICKEVGCNNLIQIDKTYCDRHKKEKRTPFQNAVRTNENLYNTSQWRRLRKKILKDQPYCVKCGINEQLEAHHKTPPRGNEELFFDENNLIILCRSCHRTATAKEIKNRRTPSPM